MKKLYLILVCGLMICGSAYAKRGLSEYDIKENFINLSVGETYNLYLNRKKYPILDKFIQQYTEYTRQSYLYTVASKKDKDYRDALAYSLYEIDIDKERVLFYQKVDEGKIKTNDRYFDAFVTFLLLHCLANIYDENFDNILENKYRDFYQFAKKESEIELMTKQFSTQESINQNIYMR